MSDYAKRPTQAKMARLSRCLAALCIRRFAETDAKTAADAITDGYHDQGIDALHFDLNTSTLYLVTTKFSEEGKNPLKPDACGSFVEGISLLLNQELDRFNDKIKAKKADILSALQSRRHVSIEIIAAHTANDPIPEESKRRVREYVDELNNPIETARPTFLSQSDIYELVTAPPQISMEISLKHWGFVDSPCTAYYGAVEAADIAQWWHQHGNDICDKNLRHFMRSTAVNDAMRKTLREAPENFWYFNNGITIICEDVVKKHLGGTSRDYGVFSCRGVSVVNGAQTVGSIGQREHGVSPDLFTPPSGTVHVRIVSLKGSPVGFAGQITRATNTQNTITRRDFASMDPTQHRIAKEFILQGRQYAFRSGEADPTGERGCSIAEASVALACRHSIGHAVAAKRELGSLWEDISAPPYTDLFNDGTTSNTLWRAVLVLRAVEDELHELQQRSTTPRGEMTAVHFNRVILHLVFKGPELSKLVDWKRDHLRLVASAKAATVMIYEAVCMYLDSTHRRDYLASLAKSFTVCEQMSEAIVYSAPDIVSIIKPSKTPVKTDA